MTALRLPSVLILAALVVASACLPACDPNNPESNEAPVRGSGYSLSVFTKAGVPARLAPASTTAAATTAAATASAGAPIIAKGGAADDPNQPGRFQMLYIRVNFPDDMREWITKDDAYDACRNVADYFAENSYGALQISSDVTALLTMPRSYLYYREVPTHVGLAGASLMWSDALAVAQKAGYDPVSYDAITVCHRTMFSANNSLIQVQDKGWPVLAHELGHVLGAGHSLRWQTDGTSSHGARDWRRFGLGTVTNLYNDQVVAYGDPWCMMGGGTGHYSLYWKLAMGWLPQAQVANITSSGRYRITALDYPTLQSDRIYGFKITRNNQQTWYGGYRLRQIDGRSVRFPLTAETWLPSSLLIWGGPWDGSREKNTPPLPGPYLIDTNPGSPVSLTGTVATAAPIDGANVNDAGIQVGRTWSDTAAGIHVTVVDRVRSEPEALDVVVNLGTFPGNRKPTVTLTATGGTLADSGQYMVTHTAGSSTPLIGFQAVASDADGDELAYFWDFGDVTNSSVNSSTATHAWSDATAGSGRLLTVRVVVSDMKGGVASAILPINIGLSEYPAVDVADTSQRQVLWAKGRIVDQAGAPVEGVRVMWLGTPWRGTWTDSNGQYWLGQLSSTQHSFEARSETMYTVGVNDAAPLPSPIRFSNRDMQHLDFIAYKRQTVTVATSTPNVAPSTTALFTLTRSFGTPGTFTRPAAYTLTDLTSAPTPPLYVRLYTGAGSTWEWRPAGGSWAALPNFFDIPFQTPEDSRQDRRETGIATNPPNPDPSPLNDYYVRFPQGVNSVEVRCSVGATVPVWQRQVSLMVGHSPDYYADVNQSTVIISNPIPATTPTVTLTATGSSIFEGSGEAVLVTASLDVPTPTRLVIPVSITGATSRLTSAPATLVIEPGGTSASFKLSSIDDTLIQGTELATVTISSGSGYNLGTATAGITVVDNDRQRVWITNTVNPAREDNGSGAVVSATFVVHRSGNLAAALVVNLATAGTATASIDYTMPSTVTIPAGLASTTVTLTPIADTTGEGDETAVISIVQSNDNLVVNPGSATCVIQDKDLPDITISGGGTVTEGGSATIRFTRNRVTTSAQTVLFELSGTASYVSNDYDIPQMATYGRITIPAGAATYDVQVNAANDLVREITNEDSEYVFVQLLRSAGYNIIPGQDQATVTITDNDSSALAEVNMELPTYTVREGEAFNIDIVWSDWPTEPSDLDHPVPSLYASVEYEVVTDDRAAAVHPATAGTHFTAVAATRVTNTRVQVFATQERRVHLVVGTLHDGAYGPDRTFLIRLKNPLNCGLPQVRAGSADLSLCVVTIKDIDSGTVSISAPTATATAGPPAVPGLLQLARTNITPAPVDALNVVLEMRGKAVPDVDFTTFGIATSSAAYGGDVTMLRQVTIPAAAATLDIPINALGAGVERGLRDLQVRVVSAAGYDYDDTDYATVNITSTDTDTRPYVSIAATQPVAYETGTTTMTFTLTRTGSTATALTVPLSLSTLGNAVAADVTSVPASATIPAGSTTALVQLQAVNDGVLEGTETAILALVANPAASFRIGGSGAATGWVVDSSLPLPEIAVDTIQATVLEEDDEAATGDGSVGRLRLRRSGEQAYPLSVNLTIGGTAANGTDYATLATTAVIPAGAVTLDLDIDPLQDSTAEGDETAIVTVATGTGYTPKAGFDSGTVTIIDDEAASVSIARQGDGAEGGAPVTYLLTRSSSDISAALTVDIVLSGDADPLADLAAAATTVQATFLAGNDTVVLSLAVVDDAVAELDEALIATVVAGAGYVPGTDNPAQALVLDNDTPRISVALAAVGVDADLAYENVSGSPVPKSLRFTRTVTTGTLTAYYTVAGTATSGSDYVTLTGSVDFTAGQASVDVPVTPFDDVLIESPETVIVTLDADTTYNLNSSASTATITIVSDDEMHVGVVGPANYLNGSAFCGQLVFRFYRIGSTDGPLRVNYAMSGTVVEGTDFALGTGYVDITDGDASVDLPIILVGGYDATTRKTLTCTVSTPTNVGSYVPGGITGITGGLLSATCQVLKTGDTNLVRLDATEPTAIEGGTDATLGFSASNALAATQSLPVTRIPGISTATAGSDYTIAPTPASLTAALTATTAVLDAPADYLEFEDREYVLLALNQPTATAPADPAFWSVGLPALFSIVNALPPQPDIVLRDGGATGTDVPLIESMIGTQAVNTAFVRTYYIVNTGTLDLTVTGIALDPAHPPVNCTVVITPPTLPVTLTPGTSTSFTATITPTAYGVWSFGFRIDSNDPDEDPMACRVYGIGDATTTTGTSGGSTVTGTGEGGACGVGALAGLIVGLGILVVGMRRHARKPH